MQSPECQCDMMERLEHSERSTSSAEQMAAESLKDNSEQTALLDTAADPGFTDITNNHAIETSTDIGDALGNLLAQSSGFILDPDRQPDSNYSLENFPCPVLHSNLAQNTLPQDSLSGSASHEHNGSLIASRVQEASDDDAVTIPSSFVEHVHGRLSPSSLMATSSSHHVPDVSEDTDFPSSSPPVSSPVDCFRSSSPIPPSSPPNLTPPTSPVRSLDACMDPTIKSNNESSDIGLICKEPEIEEKENQVGINPEKNGEKTTAIEGRINEDIASEDTGLVSDDEIASRKVQQNLIPGPKRATLAAQKMQYTKLSKPFRPPTVQVPLPKPTTILPCSKVPENSVALNTTSFAQRVQQKLKNRTAKVGAQFKSPLAPSSDSDEAGPLVRPTPTIQALERKLQLLKRAVKVRENSEEDVLAGLIRKWTEAGRDIAWEVWQLVKENVGDAERKRKFEDSWGWEVGEESKRMKTEERHWGWDVIPVHEREEGSRRTMGTMLMELGIALETFGWNADEETFVD